MRATLIALSIAVAAGLAWFGWRAVQDHSKQPVTITSPVATRAESSSAQSPAQLDAATPVQLVDDPAKTQEERLAFHARVRGFFAQAPAMSAADRQREAKSIGTDVAEYESRGELSAGEALLLKSALIRESVVDPAAQAEQIAALERSYRVESDRRRDAWESRRDPMFELYKLREAAIVTNVMAMSEIPGGLSRDEYLRQKLQEERELLLEGKAP
ncbi:hypothetical protein HNQ60_001532 [Povalibacter uvarum]|uniref:Uncharacterized protein n=1 Tax=Povalibacter uvarum TaxID=732238 RepID=A0A841HJ89_9GAMM|nr:hypothetical protein [Povalibacter uvarum]MBB6092654.1 hypothetical protein [Povalibacter uvarum]